MSNIFGFMFFLMMIPLIIVLIIVYVKSKKVYPLMYTLSIFAYINTVTYVIDAFKLEKDGIVAILAFSALLMFLLGIYIARKKKSSNIETSQQ